MKVLWLFVLMMLPLSLFAEEAPALPSNGASWLDGKALKWEDLKGKVVLMNVWTFG